MNTAITRPRLLLSSSRSGSRSKGRRKAGRHVPGVGEVPPASFNSESLKVTLTSHSRPIGHPNLIAVPDRSTG
jgi:hypothetical protein